MSYQNYGVRDYAKTDYRKPGTKLVATVSIYEFGLGAGRVRSLHDALASGRDPATLEPQAARIGAGGFRGTNAAECSSKRRFSLQIDLADENEDVNEAALFAAAREILPALARAAATSITGGDNTPASPLVADNLVWGGATYVSQSVLDVENYRPWLDRLVSKRRRKTLSRRAPRWRQRKRRARCGQSLPTARRRRHRWHHRGRSLRRHAPHAR